MEEKYTISDIFGENVFSDKVMQERLPKKVYKNLKKKWQVFRNSAWVMQISLQRQ